MTTRRIEIERFSLISSKPFQAVLAYPSHSTGFELDKPFRIRKSYPKVFTTAKAVWRVVARAADGPATP